MRYGRLFHWVFEHDPAMGFSADRINYGPIDCTASSWIVPGTIVEEEPELENGNSRWWSAGESPPEYEWEMDNFERSYEKGEW